MFGGRLVFSQLDFRQMFMKILVSLTNLLLQQNLNKDNFFVRKRQSSTRAYTRSYKFLEQD
ncbi:hypothetical protein BpHYR1_007397 [Brachionus plicatilis]|uniref:Uncharacterized protein n=1 Tax=Brachionus plicatilis TaxID=10195 RepID=A0A3M7RVE4_BRAPC|nr:hypothetical protein BpHYR1_007397 [Brachionus plicatilis]